MPKGQRRPVDVIGNAVKMMQIATGNEDVWRTTSKNAAAKLSDERKK